MNEITLHGNVSMIHSTSNAGDVPVFSFDLAVDNGYRSRTTSEWVSDPVFHRVVTFRRLAENVQTTFINAAKGGVGMAVSVTGRLKDDSYTPAGEDRPVRRLQFTASDVNPSLRYATAVVDKNA